VLGTFCLRYERRSEIYLLLVVVVSAAALAQFFLLLLTGHARELRSRASTWTLLLLTLMVFSTVVAACGAGAGANKSCENALADLAHGAFPARVSFSSSRADPAGRLRIRAKSLAGHEEVEHLSAKEEVLAIASDQLEIINHVNDARIFGVTADVSTVMSVVTAGLSAYVFIFFLLFEISTD